MMNWNGRSWYLVKQLAFCCWVAPPQSDGASGPSCLSWVSCAAVKLLVNASVAMPLESWSLIFWRMARTDARSAAAAAVSLTVMTSRATIVAVGVGGRCRQHRGPCALRRAEHLLALRVRRLHRCLGGAVGQVEQDSRQVDLAGRGDPEQLGDGAVAVAERGGEPVEEGPRATRCRRCCPGRRGTRRTAAAAGR